jgi:hypothetical protein
MEGVIAGLLGCKRVLSEDLKLLVEHACESSANAKGDDCPIGPGELVSGETLRESAQSGELLGRL